MRRDARARARLPDPYLGLFREDPERCIAFMPAAQGVLKWPTARPALATLIDEFSMPLPDAAVDRILWSTRWKCLTIRSACCARCGACWRRPAG
jgi:hypothetical protein